MASSDLKYKRTMTDRVAVRGVLSNDGTHITYQDENKQERDISITELLHPFEDETIDMTISLKTEEDLDVGYYTIDGE